jgi:uncharacterized membrane protein
MTSNTSANTLPDDAGADSDQSTDRAVMLLPWTFAIGLTGLLLATLSLRLYGLGYEDFWLDEIHSMSNSAGLRAEFEALPHGVILEPRPTYTELPAALSAADVWRGMEADSHPPIYFVVLMYWRQLFGDREAICRILPALLSVLSIVPVALILREYGPPRAALLAAIMLGLASSHVHMAQQSRPYSLGILLVAMSYWFLARLDVRWKDMSSRTRIAWLIAYGLAIYAAAMTHYFTCLAMLGHVVFVIVCARGRFIGAWCATVAASIIAFVATWGPQLLGQLDFISTHVWILEKGSDHWLRTILRAADLPIRLLFVHREFHIDYLRSLAGVAVILVPVIILRRHRVAHAAVFMAWYLVTVIAFTIIDLATDRQLLSHVRYVCVATPGLVGIIAMALFRLRPTVWRTATICFVLTVALTLRLPTISNPHNNLASRLIGERLQTGSLLVYDATDWPPYWVSQIYHNVAYYLPKYLATPAPDFVLLRDRPEAELRNAISAYEQVVVVAPRFDEVPNPLPERYRLVDRTQHVEQIGFIYRFSRIDND